MKVVVFILCMIMALALIMQAFAMINQPSWLWNAGGLLTFFLVGYSTVKTKCFTEFKKN